MISGVIVFLLRAIFWVAVVAVLGPREPDSGLPRGAGDANVMIDNFRQTALARISRVKAEFAADNRERLSRSPPA